MRDRKIDGEDPDLEAIIKDVSALKSDIGRLMAHVKTDAAETVNGSARRIYGSLAAEGERSVSALVQQVEERPIASVLIAFAVGFIGSRLLAR
jgi:hypothetical protein